MRQKLEVAVKTIQQILDETVVNILNATRNKQTNKQTNK